MTATPDTGAPPNEAEQLRIFRHAARLLASSLEFEQTLANTIAVCLPALGDFGIFDALTDDGVRRTVRAHEDAGTESLLAAAGWLRLEDSRNGSHTLYSGEAMLHAGIDDDWYRRMAGDEAQLTLLRKLAFRSMITVPVRFGGQLLGALTLFMGRERRDHDHADLEFAHELAALAAPAVVNVSLLEKQRRAEAALKESEERLRLATDAGRIGIWDWDIGAGHINWSDRVYQLHGIAKTDFSGRPAELTRLIHPEDRRMLWDGVVGALSADQALALEFRALRADGGEGWLSAWARVHRDEAEGTVRLIGATIDITAHKRVEERLRLLDSLSEATRGATDPHAIMQTTTALLGAHLGVTRCAFADVEADNNRFTIHRDWTATGAASSAGVYQLDLFGRRAAADMRLGRKLVICDVDAELSGMDGAVMFNAIGIKAIICCPLVKEGRLRAMMAVHQDCPREWRADEISLLQEMVERCWAHIERIGAMVALRKSEAHLSLMFAQTSAGIAEADLEGRLTAANDRYCRILGRPREDLIGRFMHELTAPEDLARNVALFGDMVERGVSFELEKRYLRPDGETVWVSVTVSPICGADGGKPESALAVVLDISERKRAQESLIEADRRKDEFLAMLAHELRNPLAPIRTAAELLRLGRVDAARVTQCSEIISRQASHMAGLIDDLMDVSRVTRGLVVLDKSRQELGAVLADAVEQVRPLVGARRHRLSQRLATVPVHVYGDKKRLVQVVVNLLTNAAKYTPDGGEILLSLETDGGHVTVSVSDNGIGMSQELVQSAFELFAQAERTPDRAQGGLGIGLALVRSLVELHGGEVAASSEGPGRGTTFTVRLPCMDAADAAGAQDAAWAPVMAAASLRIMVVDDNVDAAGTLATFLQALGHTVSVEHDAQRALRRAGVEKPDVCLLDIGLPGMDGRALARALRGGAGTSAACLIALTGYGQEEDRRQALEAGFDYHLVKPVNLERLANLLLAPRPASKKGQAAGG